MYLVLTKQKLLECLSINPNLRMVLQIIRASACTISHIFFPQCDTSQLFCLRSPIWYYSLPFIKCYLYSFQVRILFVFQPICTSQVQFNPRILSNHWFSCSASFKTVRGVFSTGAILKNRLLACIIFGHFSTVRKIAGAK